mmetsp:Transcript_99002/g.317507  ORF Transcript_99002/g.317507 Transcript_99002/m.317507 type:complete len:245 (+) Transcript_99002:159-893(+)
MHWSIFAPKVLAKASITGKARARWQSSALGCSASGQRRLCRRAAPPPSRPPPRAPEIDAPALDRAKKREDGSVVGAAQRDVAQREAAGAVRAGHEKRLPQKGSCLNDSFASARCGSTRRALHRRDDQKTIQLVERRRQRRRCEIGDEVAQNCARRRLHLDVRGLAHGPHAALARLGQNAQPRHRDGVAQQVHANTGAEWPHWVVQDDALGPPGHRQLRIPRLRAIRDQSFCQGGRDHSGPGRAA